MCTSNYDGLIFLGDYNAGVEGKNINIFCSHYKNCIKAMCYKNPDKPTCIDLIIKLVLNRSKILV